MISAFRHRSTAKKVLRLLAAERRALLSADVVAMDKSCGALITACDALESLPASDDREFHQLLMRIRHDAARNQRLAEASRRGLDAASRLQKEFEGVRNTLTTYNGDGLRQSVQTTNATRDRRA